MRGTKLHLSALAQRVGGRLQKNRKVQGETAIRKNLGFWTLISHAACSVFAKLQSLGFLQIQPSSRTNLAELKTQKLFARDLIKLFFYLNFANFLHMFIIEKYQEFVYFDIFLVFVQKNRKMQISDSIWCKKELLGQNYKDSHKRGTKLHHSASAQHAGGRLQKFQKVQGETAIRENLGFWTLTLALDQSIFSWSINILPIFC